MLIIKNNNFAKIKQKSNKLLFNGIFGNTDLIIIKEVKIFLRDNFIIIKSNQKKYLNLYYSLIKQKIKGVLQGYRISLFIKGIGYKIIITDNSNLKLKLGYSYLINIKIPKDIQIVLNKKNFIVLGSNDLCKLTLFIHYIKNLRKPCIYKEKGLFFKNEYVKLKEIKKNKK